MEQNYIISSIYIKTFSSYKILNVYKYSVAPIYRGIAGP